MDVFLKLTCVYMLYIICICLFFGGGWWWWYIPWQILSGCRVECEISSNVETTGNVLSCGQCSLVESFVFSASNMCDDGKRLAS